MSKAQAERLEEATAIICGMCGRELIMDEPTFIIDDQSIYLCKRHKEVILILFDWSKSNIYGHGPYSIKDCEYRNRFGGL